MNTAEQIRRQQIDGYYRLCQQQEIILREYLVPLARLTGEKLRELYPDAGEKKDIGNG